MNQQFSHADFVGTSIVSRHRLPMSSSVVSPIAVLIDSLVILCTGIILYSTLIPSYHGAVEIYAGAVCFVLVVSLLLFQFSGLYDFDAFLRPFANLDRLFISIASAILFLLAVAFAFKTSETLSRMWIVSFALAVSASVTIVRVILSRLLLRLARAGAFKRSVVLVGSSAHIARLITRMRQLRAEFVSVVGVFVDGPEGEMQGVPVLGHQGDVSAFVRQTNVDDVVISMPWSAEPQITALVERLRELPVNVYLGADLVGLSVDYRDPPGHFKGVPVFAVIGRPLSGWGVAIKGIEDLVIATGLLILALPIMTMVAIAIRLDSPGPVLFRQKRLGFNNQEFDIFKFRSMRHQNHSDGPTRQARRGDERITAVGRMLRRTSLDELPQLFNVLNGTMSLVGPRPHALDHNQEFSEKIRGYFARHRMKPGITGWAQVNGLRGQTDTPEKMADRVRADVYYIENWSLLFDLYILARTISVTISGRNAY